MNKLQISHTVGQLPEMSYNEWITYIINQIHNDNN